MYVCIVPTILILIAGAVLYAISRSKKADAAWLEASKRLKLRYHKTGTFGKREMTGKVDNFTTRVQTVTQRTANNSTTFTHYTVRWQKRRHDYKLTRSKALSAVATFFGAPDVEIGAAEFDRGVVVNSEHPTDIRNFLSAERQKQVMRVLLSYPGASVKNGRVDWKDKGLATSSAQIEGVIRRFVKLARVMSSDYVFHDEPGDEPDVMGDPLHFKEEVARSEWHWKRGKVDKEDQRPVHSLPPVFEPVEEAPTVAPTPAPPVREPVALQPVPVERLPIEPEPVTPEPPAPPIPFVPVVPLPVAATPAPETSSPPADAPPVPDDRKAVGFAEQASLQASELGGGSEAPAPSQALAETSFAAGEASEAMGGATADAPPAPVTPVEQEEREIELSAASICEDLFAGNPLGMDVTTRFEERYQDHAVRWSGKLERVDSYYSDFVFGSTPGAKASIELYELRDETYGSGTVRAVVQLSEEEGASLQTRSGETIAFEGRLARCEPYMRNLLVANGHLV